MRLVHILFLTILLLLDHAIGGPRLTAYQSSLLGRKPPLGTTLQTLDPPSKPWLSWNMDRQVMPFGMPPSSSW